MHALDRVLPAINRLSRALGRGVVFPEPSVDDAGRWAGPDLPGTVCQGPLAEILRTHRGNLIDKWEHYIEVYERYLSPYRQGFPLPGGGGVRPLRLLEIGVFQGGSLEVWRRYFGQEAVIFGIDIDPRCAAFDGRFAKIRIGSQADPAFLAAVVREMGGVDIVIDDGSHIASHQRITLETLFPLVTSGGLYMCEDVHTAYWAGQYEGGHRRHGTFIELTKELIDDLHATWHWRKPALPCAAGQVTALHVHDSMVVVEKAPKPAPRRGRVGTPAW